MKSGWKISVGVSIDYTLSNKPSNDPRSYHWQNEHCVDMNPYEKAIFEIGSVLEQYVYDKKFHLLGFGGEPHYLQD